MSRHASVVRQSAALGLCLVVWLCVAAGPQAKRKIAEVR
jgi:hypothetical protein